MNIKERVAAAIAAHSDILRERKVNVALSRLPELSDLTPAQVARARRKRTSTENTRRWRSENPGRYLWLQARYRAKKRNVYFEITPKDVVVPDYCPVMGIRMVMGNGKKSGPTPNSPTLDRIDPSKGYTPENVWVISWRANILKGDATIEELEALLVHMRRHAEEAGRGQAS